MSSMWDFAREVDKISNRVKEYFENLERSQSQSQTQTQTQAAPRPSATPTPASFPDVDLWEDDASFQVVVDLPGMTRENIRLSIVGDNVIEINGRRRDESGAEHTVLSSERWQGEFRRLVTIPDRAEVAFDRINASFRDGVLTITIPKRESAVRRTIDIN